MRSKKYSTVSNLGSALIGAAGTALGFAVGTLIIPGVGSACGAVTGGIIFSYYGGEYSLRFYQGLEDKFTLFTSPHPPTKIIKNSNSDGKTSTQYCNSRLLLPCFNWFYS